MSVRGSVVKFVAVSGLLLSGLATVVVQATPAAAATITVTSTAQENPFVNNNQCTLGEAIQAANTNTAVDSCAAGTGASDTITLAANATYTLSAGPFSGVSGPDGLPVVTTAITIQGNGATITRSTVAGTPAFRLMEVDAAGNLTLDKVSVTNGFSFGAGGAVLNCGTLATQNGASFSGNFADSLGGAVSDDDCPGGSVATTITNTTFSGNSSTDEGGAICLEQGVISFSTFTDNQSNGDDAGAIETFGVMTISDSTFLRNHALGNDGGAINLDGSSSEMVTVTRSTFTDNTAVHSGGAIDNDGQPLQVSDSTFTHNQANAGGAIQAEDTSAVITVTGSTFVNNSASDSGGALFLDGAITVTNSTFSANAAPSGGAIYVNSDTLNLNNSTLSGNTASISGGGIFNSGGTANVKGTIINASTNGNCSGVVTNGGANISFPATDVTCTGFGSLNPLLGPLASNGGPTQTFALLTGSGAVNVIPVGPNCPATDQRGVIRPQGTNCDIGAFEVDNTPPTCTVANVVGPPKKQVLTISDTGGFGAGAVYNLTITNGTTVISPYSPGATSFTVTATKTDQTKSTTWSLDVRDIAGNVKHCS